MREPFVSVIVPTYNRAYCLAATVDSALGQTHSHIEVIIIDDGSTDGTSDLVAGRYGHEPRVRYIRQANAGVSAARNHGIRLVRGDYVSLLDSDDVWLPFKVELQLACLRAYPDAGMVWTDMHAVDPDGNVIGERYLERFYSGYRLFDADDLFDRSQPLVEIVPHLAEIVGSNRVCAGDVYAPMVLGNLVHTSTVLMSRDRLAAAGCFDERQRSGEDHEFHLRTCRAGRVAFADIPTIKYLVGREDQLTRPQFKPQIAQKFLTTMTDALAQDRDRITLPQSLIDDVLADAHFSLGEALLDQARAAEARPHLLATLRHKPWQRRPLMLWSLSFVPPPVLARLRAVLRRLREPGSADVASRQHTSREADELVRNRAR